MYHWRNWKASQVTLTQTTDGGVAKVFKVIKKVSTKQAKLNAVYNVAASQFKNDYPECQVKLEGCQYYTVDVHHLYSGASRTKYFLDSREWKTTCDACHFKMHNVLSKEEMFKLGLKKTAI